jgi:hypothetical protein
LRTIPKQYAGIAIIPVDQFRDALGANDEDALCLTRLYELVCNRHAIDKTRARFFGSDARTCGNTQAMLNEGRCIRKYQVWRRRTDNDHLDIFGFDTGVFDRDLGGLNTHVGRCLVFSNAMTALDTRSRANPLIARIDDLLEIEIGQYLLRQVTPGSDNSRVRHAASFCSRFPICCGTCFCTSTTAVLIA